jgi:ligand-binding SRPBCC domain-containing protein
MRIVIQTLVEQDYKTVFQGFNRELFMSLRPPLMGLELKRFDGCQKGDMVSMELRPFYILRQAWTSLITDSGEETNGYFFVDESQPPNLPAPLKTWKHRHRVLQMPENACLISDEIEYTAVFGLNWLMYPVLWLMFAWRKPIYKKYFKK